MIFLRGFPYGNPQHHIYGAESSMYGCVWSGFFSSMYSPQAACVSLRFHLILVLMEMLRAQPVCTVREAKVILSVYIILSTRSPPSMGQWIWSIDIPGFGGDAVGATSLNCS